MVSSGKTNKGEDGDEVKWTAWDWFTTILEVLIGIGVLSADNQERSPGDDLEREAQLVRPDIGVAILINSGDQSKG